jgi:hypothetical protein
LGILNPDVGLPQPIAFSEENIGQDRIRIEFGIDFDVPELLEDNVYSHSRCLKCPWTAWTTVILDKDYICHGRWYMAYGSSNFGKGKWDAKEYPWFKKYDITIPWQCGIMIWRELWRLGFIPRSEWEGVKTMMTSTIIYDEEYL